MSDTETTLPIKSPWLASFLQSPNFFCIKVGSGEKQEAFYVHEKILKSSSLYFETLIGSDFIEASTKEVVLDDAVDDPEAFKFIIDYMYSPTKTYHVWCKENARTDRKYSSTSIVHARIFIMANRLIMVDLEEVAFRKIRDAILESWRDRIDWNVGDLCTIIDLIYSHTSIESTIPRKTVHRLRDVLSHYCACCISSIRKEERFKELFQKHLEFTEGVMEKVEPSTDRERLGMI